LPKKEETAA